MNPLQIDEFRLPNWNSSVVIPAKRSASRNRAGSVRAARLDPGLLAAGVTFITLTRINSIDNVLWLPIIS